MLQSSVVASAAQAALAATIAFMIQRGAATSTARWLALVFGLFAAYSAAIAAGYTLVSERTALGHGLFLLCLCFAYASSLAFSGFLSARFVGMRIPSLTLVFALVPAVGLVGLGFWALSKDAQDPRSYALLTILTLTIQVVNLVRMVRLRRKISRRDVRALRTYLWALLLAFLPMVLDVVNTWVVTVPFYRIARNLATMGFLYALLAAFLSDTVQLMSLKARALGGTLTISLGIVVVVGELLIGPKATEQAHEASLRLIGLTALLVVGLPLLVGFLYRRSLINPLEQLVDGVVRADDGTFAPLEVQFRDEIGVLTESFNRTMLGLTAAREELEARVRDLARRNEQVEELNDELRWQLESRSKDLANMTNVGTVPHDCREGDILGGRYRVIDLLGRGGMGAVYRVARLRDERQFALKLVQEPDAQAAARFAREAEVAVKLTGPNLVSVVDVGITDGRPFLVMELVLDGSLEDQRSKFGETTWALGILHQIATGLATIHDRGVIHRDLKPANVLLASADGVTVAKISDFGIAKERVNSLAATLPHHGSGQKLTATGALIGTVNYMAPELATRGQEATFAVDVFALGLIAWELCSGALPFKVPPIFIALGGGTLPAPSPLPVDVEPELATLLRRCIAADPSERPTAEEVEARLGRGLAGAVYPPM